MTSRPMTDRQYPPRVEDAPGLIWRLLKSGWEARWQARTDLVRRGFPMKSAKLWTGWEPDEIERQYISDGCTTRQAEMLVWAHGGIKIVGTFTGTLGSLIACYRADPDSGYRKLRYRSRVNRDDLMRRLDIEHGDMPLSDIKARLLLRWHERWGEGGKVAMAHSLIAALRSLCKFGKTILEDADCTRIKDALHDMRFPMPKPRGEIVTAAQVVAIRALAHERGQPAIALAQAFQFECTLRQKDVIGEWVPNSEPGITEVTRGNEKWLRGLRWEEIDRNLILVHVTSKRQKELVVDLKLAPMVMEELAVAYPGFTSARRDLLPAKGAIVLLARTQAPYPAWVFRRDWRLLARHVGVPDHVYNMDNRAGAISEATDSGASLESVRHAATHSDIATTARYSRNAAVKTAEVMVSRVAKRIKNTND